jgi:hypothetical protein
MLRRLLTTSLIVASTVLPCALNAAEPAPTRSNSTPQRALELQAPEIGRIFSLAQINAVLSRAVDPSLEYVEVEALRLGDLPFEDSSASPTESIARTVAWLFVPSPAFASVAREAPDATYSHRPAPTLQANYHASFDQP